MLRDILNIGSTILDKLFPDKGEAERNKLKLFELSQAGEFRELDAAMQILLAESNSKDKWTSRARPSFLYVMYTMILVSIPMGCLYAYNPVTASHIATGMKEWLAAIPRPLWVVFGLGYTGYVMGRSKEKVNLLKIMSNIKV